MRRIILIALFMLTASTGYAQIENCTFYKQTIDSILAAPNAAAVTTQSQKLFDISQGSRCFAMFATGIDLSTANQSVFQEFVRRFESSRPDKQSGSSGGGTGSTSVVAQGPVAKVLSVATEYGALTQSVGGQVVTVRANLGGLPAALVRKNIFPYCVPGENLTGFCVQGSMLSVLSRFSFGASFDATRSNQQVTGTPAATASGTAQPVSFSGNKREISAISAHVELWNTRNTNTEEFQTAWKAKVGEALQKPAADLLNTAGDFVEPVVALPGYRAWYTKSVARIQGAPDSLSRERIITELRAALAELEDLLKKNIPDYRKQAASAMDAYSRFFLEQDTFIDKLATKSVLAVEYINSRPTGQPQIHNFRMIWDVPLNKQTKFVANGAANFYNSVPADAKASVAKFRDAQFGLQLDHGLGKNSLTSAATISIAGYYQYQHAPTMLEVDPANPVSGVSFAGLPSTAKTVFTKTGSIFLTQAKLTLAPTNSSVKVPVSMTYSNRTELINKPIWRAQVGLTYDFDSLFSGLAKK